MTGESSLGVVEDTLIRSIEVFSIKSFLERKFGVENPVNDFSTTPLSRVNIFSDTDLNIIWNDGTLDTIFAQYNLVDNKYILDFSINVLKLNV